VEHCTFILRFKLSRYQVLSLVRPLPLRGLPFLSDARQLLIRLRFGCLEEAFQFFGNRSATACFNHLEEAFSPDGAVEAGAVESGKAQAS
jgi:hypothetical protein